MAITVSTPKNLKRIKPKFIGSFTKRQFFSIAGAALVGIPFYYFTKGFLGTDISALLMVALMFPFLLFMSDNLKFGLPAEKLILLVWRHFRSQGIRPYRAENLFKQLEEREKIKKEVEFLEEKARSGKRRK